MTSLTTRGWMYNPCALSNLRRTYLVALAALVAAFVALYPYLGGMGPCYGGECPYATHSSSEGSAGGFAVGCVGAGTVASAAVVLASAASRGRRADEAGSRPAQLYLSPDPPPPRLS
jgi:hypothetical protein